MGDEVTEEGVGSRIDNTPKKMSFRARCRGCKRNDFVDIPRFGRALVIPSRIVCVICGATMLVLSKDLKRLMSGAPSVEDL